MQFTALLGLISGFILLIWAIASRGPITTFWDPAAVVIVLGGTMAAVVISHSNKQIRRVPQLLRRAFGKNNDRRQQTRNRLVHLARRARREGLLALEDDLAEIEDEFLYNAVQMLVDATPAEDLKDVMQSEMEHAAGYQDRGTAMFETAGASSPAFGMIGTLIGLIHMLQDLDDPDAIGGGMAVALITTFYGSLLGNLVFTPIARKLNEVTEEQLQIQEMTLEGILAIQEGKNPRMIAAKLDAFLDDTEEQEESETTDKETEGTFAEERSDVASDD